MSDRDLDHWIAEKLMGWKFHKGRNEMEWWDVGEKSYLGVEAWLPTTDHNDAARVRARIAELELQREFIKALYGETPRSAWECMQSSCRVQMEAAKAAWEARNG